MPVLHLVGTCTDRKRIPVPPSLRIRTIRAVSPHPKSVAWVDRLTSHTGTRSAAIDTYVGEVWSETRAAASPCDSLSVLSAGYGLIPAEASIHPYGATFQMDSPDRVARDASEAAQWWELINDWRGPTSKRLSLRSLSRSGTVLIAASPGYLAPLRSEIEQLDPANVLIISAGAPAGLLADYRLPADGRLRLALGGSMMAVNIRLARALTETHGQRLTRASAERTIAKLVSDVGELPTFNRQRLTDEQVLCEIDRIRRRTVGISASAAHRQLRDEGLACEQRRFKALFAQGFERNR